MIKLAAVLALLGATLGTGLDALHVLSGTTRYTEPLLFGIQAWWTPPLFAAAAVTLGASRAWAGGDDQPRALPAMALFVLAYVTSAALDGLLRTIVLVLIALVAVLACDRSARGAALAVWAGIMGTLSEMALVNEGAFRYLDRSPLGVPDWLPFLYVTAAVGVGALARRISAGRSA